MGKVKHLRSRGRGEQALQVIPYSTRMEECVLSPRAVRREQCYFYPRPHWPQGIVISSSSVRPSVWPVRPLGGSSVTDDKSGRGFSTACKLCFFLQSWFGSSRTLFSTHYLRRTYFFCVVSDDYYVIGQKFEVGVPNLEKWRTSHEFCTWVSY